jgi:hypothetical protein
MKLIGWPETRQADNLADSQQQNLSVPFILDIAVK